MSMLYSIKTRINLSQEFYKVIKNDSHGFSHSTAQ